MNPINTSEVYPICDILSAYEAVQGQVKKLFEQFISDKSVPLDDRWAIFVNAPDSLKNHWVHRYAWQCHLLEESVQDYYYLHSRVNTAALVDNMQDCMDTCEYADVQFDIEKENILRINLGSYIYNT